MLALTESGSVYEIDLTNRQARRLSGVAAPTPRTGPDGTWRRFVGMMPASIGARLFFEWDPAALPAGTAAAIDMRPATMTSIVTRLTGTPEELEAAGAGAYVPA